MWFEKIRLIFRLLLTAAYRKTDDDTTQLIIDEESAAVVRRIFKMSVEGLGPSQIARMLCAERILNPSAYKHSKGILSKPRPMQDQYFWHISVVKKILDAPEYLGTTINFKTWSWSYKDNQTRITPEEDRLVFENTHPAIIDRDTWDIVRRMRQHKRRAPRHGNPGLFSGTVYCSDCGKKLCFHTQEIPRRNGPSYFIGTYRCSEYTRAFYRESRRCTCHYIRESVLAEIVLDELKKVLTYVSQHANAFSRQVLVKSQTEYKRELAARKRTIEKHCCRVSELDTLFERMYEDRATGRLTDERFDHMAAKYDGEQQTLRREIKTLEATLTEDESCVDRVNRFIAAVQRCPDIQELTPIIIHEFIDKIVLYEANGRGRNRTQSVDIIFNGVGAVDTSQILDRIPS